MKKRKIVAMIPARLGSKRVPKKNLRLLNGIPLIEYPILKAKSVNLIDEIYLNSEADVFGEIADKNGINFYKRPDYLSNDTATNDDFVYDFVKNVQCDILIQILSTSPFLTSVEIYDFIKYMLDKKVETLISVKKEQIECVYNGKPINFEQKGKTLPSQQLTPVYPYACCLMGWNVASFVVNMINYGSGYHGGDCSVDYFTVKGLSTIDIDNEEDFQLAERVVTRNPIEDKEPVYYESKSKGD